MSTLRNLEVAQLVPVEHTLGGYSDRVIAYRPALARLCSSATAGLLLSQFLYWNKVIVESKDLRDRMFYGKKYKNETGWFYKSAAEIEQETCMTIDEQRTARKRLVSLDYIFEDQLEKSLNRSVFFKVNKTKISQDLILLNQN